MKWRERACHGCKRLGCWGATSEGGCAQRGAHTGADVGTLKHGSAAIDASSFAGADAANRYDRLAVARGDLQATTGRALSGASGVAHGHGKANAHLVCSSEAVCTENQVRGEWRSDSTRITVKLIAASHSISVKQCPVLPACIVLM